jgi:hypothetical protein
MSEAATPKKSGLELLREPFAAHLISKLPKPTKAQTEAVRADFKKGIRCKLCGAWHHADVVHLDYVGHAALTHRLLDADPAWAWEPLASDSQGLPLFDKDGGLWIKLTVCGVTRLGYGQADQKPNADAGAREKEVIGDALRNAAMRFGAALDLWSKADLHADEESPRQVATEPPKQEGPKQYPDADFTKNYKAWEKLISSGRKSGDEMIDMIQTKGLLSEDQKAKLNAIKRVRTMADVEAAMRAATDVDALAVIAVEQVAAVADPEERAALMAIHEQLEASLTGVEA